MLLVRHGFVQIHHALSGLHGHQGEAREDLEGSQHARLGVDPRVNHVLHDAQTNRADVVKRQVVNVDRTAQQGNKWIPQRADAQLDFGGQVRPVHPKVLEVAQVPGHGVALERGEPRGLGIVSELINFHK